MTASDEGKDGPDLRRIVRDAGLSFQSDDEPGYYRRRRGRGWSYHFEDGTLLRDESERERIQSLAIPPGWSDVWISRDPTGHLQATGRDEKGRKQYRYHPRWEEVRDRKRFHRLLAFGRALPHIRGKVRNSLSGEDLARERVLSALVAILDETGVRIGNEEYARENGTYGLATVRSRHTRVEGPGVEFEFNGKGGRTVRIELKDPDVARVVEACQATPGYEVFKWIDSEGDKHDVKADDVNDFIREISGGDFTAKDFRTWLGTVHAFEHLCQCPPPEDDEAAHAECVAAADSVAERLGNTREVARSAYIQKEVLDAFCEEASRKHFATVGDSDGNGSAAGARHLSPAERGLLRLLEAVA